tara:strand:+ start:999 stop:1181 length:183 start_codon:yes stop_codon:yes gene_type:complete
MGCSTGAVSVKIESEDAGIFAFASNPWLVGCDLRGAERLGADITIKLSISVEDLKIDPFV